MSPTELKILQAKLAAEIYANTATQPVEISIKRAVTITETLGLKADEPDTSWRQVLANFVWDICVVLKSLKPKDEGVSNECLSEPQQTRES